MCRKSKLKLEEFIGTLMFSECDHSQLSLQDCCNDLAQQHGKPFSKVALHKRFNQRSLDFLKLVLADQMASKLHTCQGTNWQPFSKVLISDSCKFVLPEEYIADYPGFGGRNKLSLMNIQYTFASDCIILSCNTLIINVGCITCITCIICIMYL